MKRIIFILILCFVSLKVFAQNNHSVDNTIENQEIIEEILKLTDEIGIINDSLFSFNIGGIIFTNEVPFLQNGVLLKNESLFLDFNPDFYFKVKIKQTDWNKRHIAILTSKNIQFHGKIEYFIMLNDEQLFKGKNILTGEFIKTNGKWELKKGSEFMYDNDVR